MFEQMTISRRLMLAAGVMALPLVALVSLSLRSSNAQAGTTASELDAVEYSSALRRLFEHAVEHRGTAGSVLGGDAALRMQALDLQGKVDADLAAAAEAAGRLGSRLASSSRLTSLTSRWEAIKSGAFSRTPRESAELHGALINEVNRLGEAATADLRSRLEANQEEQRQARLVLLAVALAGLAACGVTVLLLSGSLSRQAQSLQDVLSRVAAGELGARAKGAGGGELGEVARGLNAVLDSLTSLIQTRSERDQIQQSIQRLMEEVSGVAEGDLTAEAEVTADVTGAIADSFNFMIAELRRIISEVQSATLQVSASATQVQQTTEGLAQGSESQAMQIVEASAAIDEMAASIQQVSTNATTASSVAELAMKSAKQGAESVNKTIHGMNSIRSQVQQTAKRMKRLGESSQEIGEIVQLIDDIADRTSILALNASIQAAMAGDAGKGFAVVAEEVERLAERSTDATKRIGGLIKSIQNDTNEAISAMEETTREVVGGSNLAVEAGQTLQQIEAVSSQLAELIQAITMASRQQSRGSESVARSMGSISDVTRQTASGAKQAAQSIRRLAEMADGLRGSLNRFKLPKGSARGAAV